jgi:pSer/pThr/pTyr-binding forkhead associated (FHA) protein
MGRLTGILGLVCRRCDAYNDPGARICVACGDFLAAGPDDATPADTADLSSGPREETSPAVATPAPGASPPPAKRPRALAARVVVERGEAAPGTTYLLAQDEVQAGRAYGQVLFPDDPCLAPLHATFLVREDTLLLRDEGAAGGVYVRLSDVTVPLRPGSLFAVGDRLLRFGGPLPPPPPPPDDGTRRLGAPRPDRAVLVEEWLEGGVGGRAYLRTGPSITVGRSGCSINLGEDPYLSQAHAEIVVEAEGSAKLRDLGSSNGTFVRIPPGSERELHDGDTVRIGREVLRVEVEAFR